MGIGKQVLEHTPEAYLVKSEYSTLFNIIADANVTWFGAVGDGICDDTPAFKAAEDKKLTIAGVERSGFVLSFGQLYDLCQNKADMDAFYAALGKTAPSIHSGYWWTSCQNNAADAVILPNGSFSYTPKTYSNNVLCCFDL